MPFAQTLGRKIYWAEPFGKQMARSLPRWFAVIFDETPLPSVKPLTHQPSLQPGFSLELELALNQRRLPASSKCTNLANNSIALLKRSQSVMVGRWGDWADCAQVNSQRYFCAWCCQIECETLHKGHPLERFCCRGKDLNHWVSYWGRLDIYLHPAKRFLLCLN